MKAWVEKHALAFFRKINLLQIGPGQVPVDLKKVEAISKLIQYDNFHMSYC